MIGDREWSNPDLKAGIYQHYKGELYLVLGYARHSETDEVFVAYVPLYTHVDGVQLKGPRLCVRPVKLFFDIVPKGFHPGESQPRFRYVGSGVEP